ncbi:MAG TPA: ABC transporter permease [Burkholderiales bacterium]|jgi:ribose transport system permease protein|nr:ABC transporter permease [Burkholderiales bacterium]
MNPIDTREFDPAAGNSLGGAITRRLDSEDMTVLALFAITALLIFTSGWISPGLGSWSQARAILVVSTFVMVVGFGQQMVILTGGLDLSVPSMMTLGAILLFSYVGGSSTALIWGVPLVLLITGAIGAVSGMFIALLRVPPFIMTLAISIILGSAMLGITGGAPRGTVSPLLVRLFAGDWLGAPPVVYLMACLAFLVTLLQRRTAFGRMLYAIGTNPDAAYIAGLPVKRVTILCYAISGASAGLAGILVVGFSEGATLNSGDDVLVPSIAAVVIGGTSILGGRGTYLGVVGGALLLTTFSTMISALGIAIGWRAIIYGTVILLALLTLQEDLRLWRARLRSAFGSAPLENVRETSTRIGGTSR